MQGQIKHNKFTEDDNNCYQYRQVMSTMTTNQGERKYISCLIYYYLVPQTDYPSSDSKSLFTLTPYVLCISSEKPLFTFCKQLFHNIYTLTLVPYY